MADSFDSWFIGEFQLEDQPVVVRARSAGPPESQRTRCPHLMLIAWTYSSSGMPETEENVRMQSFQDALDDGVEQSGAGIQAAALTGAGQKEWRYYTHNPDDFMSALNEALHGHEPYPIEIQIFEDAEWVALQELLDGAGA